MIPGLIGAGVGMLGGLLSPNQQGAYNNYANAMGGIANQFTPYSSLGLHNLQDFSKENAANEANPMGEYNKIAAGWTPSAYDQNMLHGVSHLMDTNAAETGMLGSKSANDALQGDLTNMTNQFENQYIGQGMNQYNQALHNQFGLGQMGLNALGQYANLAQEGALGRLQGARANAQWDNNLFGNMLGGGLGGAFIGKKGIGALFGDG